MYLLDGLIVLAMTFFFVLPMTDAKTVRMKLSAVSCLGVLLTVSVIAPRLMHRPGRAATYGRHASGLLERFRAKRVPVRENASKQKAEVRF
jgi:hypothetical protein